MPTPSVIVPRPEIRRAKRTKFCKNCNGRIEAGTLYRIIDLWTWQHRVCPEEGGSA